MLDAPTPGVHSAAMRVQRLLGVRGDSGGPGHDASSLS
jgi:hypothetical protein